MKKYILLILIGLCVISAICAQTKLTEKKSRYEFEFRPEVRLDGPYFFASFTVTAEKLWGYDDISLKISDVKITHFVEYRYKEKVYHASQFGKESFSTDCISLYLAKVDLCLCLQQVEVKCKEANLYSGYLLTEKKDLNLRENTTVKDIWRLVNIKTSKPVYKGKCKELESSIQKFVDGGGKGRPDTTPPVLVFPNEGNNNSSSDDPGTVIPPKKKPKEIDCYPPSPKIPLEKTGQIKSDGTIVPAKQN